MIRLVPNWRSLLCHAPLITANITVRCVIEPLDYSQKIAPGLETHPSLVRRAISESTRCMGWPLGRMAINARDVDLPAVVHWAIAIWVQPETWGGVDLYRPVCNLRYPAKHFSNFSHTSSWRSPIAMARSHLQACCCSIPTP